MGDLSEWISLYRPTAVEATPPPAPVVVVPTADPVDDPKAAASPFGTVLPPIALLETVGPGVLAVVVAAALAVGLAVRLIRRADGIRRNR